MTLSCVECGLTESSNALRNIRDGHDLGLTSGLCDACLNDQCGPARVSACSTEGCPNTATWFRVEPLDGPTDSGPTETVRYPVYCDDCAPDALV